jgi:ubiquinone/menaquinone biosynthesis C-methylase UbiE
VNDPRVAFLEVSGARLDVVDDGIADVLVCYLVLQHLPSRAAVAHYLAEFRRVLAPHGEAFVQLPVLDDGLRPQVWRTLRSLVIPMTAVGPTRRCEFRGSRLTLDELRDALARARLHVLASDVGPDAPYRYSRDFFLRLSR